MAVICISKLAVNKGLIPLAFKSLNQCINWITLDSCDEHPLHKAWLTKIPHKPSKQPMNIFTANLRFVLIRSQNFSLGMLTQQGHAPVWSAALMSHTGWPCNYHIGRQRPQFKSPRPGEEAAAC